jgi:PAS domain S-box-containing protein
MQRSVPASRIALSGPVKYSILAATHGVVVALAITQWTSYVARIAVFAGLIAVLSFGIRSLISFVAQMRQNATMRQVQLELENERKVLRAFMDNIPDFMYVKDLESRFVIANKTVARWAGVEKPEDLLGKTDFDLCPRELAMNFYEDEQRVIRTRQPIINREEITGVDAIDGVHYTLTTKIPLFDDEGSVTGIAGMGRDITERKKMEDELRQTEQKYRGIFDKAVVGIFQSTPEGRVLGVNPSMAFTYGYISPEEMIEDCKDIAHQFYADSKRRDEFKFLMEKCGGVQNFECENLRRDGSKFWISMSAVAIRQKGAVVRYEGMVQDITERKMLREQLLQAQKLESIGQLAAGIAHEINTPTQYIGDNVRFLKDAFADINSLLVQYEGMLLAAKNHSLLDDAIQDAAVAADRVDTGYLLDEIPKAIEQSLEGIGRVAAIVGAMKEFSHPDTKEKVPLDLNHAINSTVTVARNEWKYVSNVETDYDPSLPLFNCLPGEFNQVILNLIVNAAHAISDVVKNGGPEKGTIKVQTKNYSDRIEIRIQDSGTGIPEKVRARIFDPFFTTKEIGKGTGQGLAIARSVIVDKHGGEIHFETETGKGTTFVICLPVDGKALTQKAVAA